MEINTAGCRLDKTGNAVDDGGLAGSVGTDDAQNFPAVDFKTDPIEGDDAAEGLGYLFDLQNRFSRHIWVHLSN